MSGSDDYISAVQVSTTINGHDDISANLPEIAWAAELARVPWSKSSRSAGNGNCVEVAALRHDLVGVRDSKEADGGPVLVFDGAAWRSFIEGVKEGN